MLDNVVFSGAEDWNWGIKDPFAQSVSVGDQVFFSGQQTLDKNGVVLDPGDIAAQTRNVFESMKASLNRVDLDLDDLVRLNTYYVFDGADDEATRYWEDMTKVRLEYFPDPGPAATAVRIKGMPYKGQLIQIEGVAVKGDSRKNRRRIMPAGSWDWSIAVPLSQGWRVGNRIFVGGQISSNENGESVHVGDLEAQTHNIYGFIGEVLNDAGASFDDVVHMKICAKHNSFDQAGNSYADSIMEIATEYASGLPVLTDFGVDLLYPGLDLEIDAMAIIDPDRRQLKCDNLGGRYQPEGFSDGIIASGEIYVGGQVALNNDGSVMDPGNICLQTSIVLERLASVLATENASLDDIAKLNLFIVGNGDDVSDEFHQILRMWSEMAPNAHPAMTPVRVHELAKPGLMVQMDCVAFK